MHELFYVLTVDVWSPVLILTTNRGDEIDYAFQSKFEGLLKERFVELESLIVVYRPHSFQTALSRTRRTKAETDLADVPAGANRCAQHR